uniref:Immunoglobulin V-set domain-containing protein n=1 Tax=Loxodonta africana TaxID=9785 RepID=G3TXI1_LOXAF
MYSVVIRFMVLCLLGTGSFDTKVTQMPRYLLKGKGQKVKMDCVLTKRHSYVYWYQQIPTKELKFLISFQNKYVLSGNEMPKERFSDKCPQDSACILEIQLVALQDSAMDLCASAL